jgi:DNA polymerase-1
MEYRKFEKLCQFCEMTEDINPKTGRIHGRINKTGTDSGRFSHSNPNTAQIPARSEEGSQFRALFKPEEGNKFIQADYSGLELLILAEFSGEDGLIEAINRGDDVHCFTMSNMLGCPYDILVRLKEGEEFESSEFTQARARFESRFQLAELLKIENPVAWVKKFRDYVKTLTYGLSYGLSEFGLKNKFHCSLEDAKAFIKEFFDAYPNLGRYLKVQGELGFQRLYAINSFGRRRYFSAPKTKSYKEIEALVIKDLDKQKRTWESVEESEWDSLMKKALEQDKREYNGKINSIKRRSANFIPQSVNADMIKIAIYLFRRYYKGEGGLVLCIHDELIAEIPEKDVDHAKECMRKAMEKAGQRFVTKCKIVVSVKTLDKWEK